MSTDINTQTIEYSLSLKYLTATKQVTSPKKKRNLVIHVQFFSDKSRYSILPFLQEARRVLELGGVLIFSTESISEAEAGSLGTIERASERFAHSRHGWYGERKGGGWFIVGVEI